MNKKRWISLIGILMCSALLAVWGFLLDRAHTIHVYGANQKEIATIYIEDNAIVYDCDDIMMAYIDMVYRELIDVIQEQESCSAQEAGDYAFKHGLDVYTYYDDEIQHQMYQAVELKKVRLSRSMATVLSDTHGHIKGCVSISTEKPNENYALVPTYAASAIKPLSIYGPAVEEGIVTFSSLYEDSAPLTNVNTKGELEPWPKNVEGYTLRDYTVAEALQKSLNTVAVRIIMDLGVETSMDYLEKFGVDVSEEREVYANVGEREILSNIALGNLRSGVTVKDMVGYYQVFANGGTYSEPHSISLVKENDKIYCEILSKEEQIFSEETAYVLNRMLSLVPTLDGTAPAAQVDGVDVCGKTGTSENEENNWFVGMTPEYVCGVWFSGLESNHHIEHGLAAEVFREIISTIPRDDTVQYPVASNVSTVLICSKTGKVASTKCPYTMMGYYIGEAPNKVCDEH